MGISRSGTELRAQPADLRRGLAGHPGQLPRVGPGPGLQRINERPELSAHTHAAQLGGIGDGTVGQLQAAVTSFAVWAAVTPPG